MIDARASELNWAGTYAYAAAEVVRPTSIDALAAVVARSPKVRALGTRHSFNDVADGPGLLVDMTGLPADVRVSTDRRTASVGAGTRYAALALALDAAGLALINMGSLPHISVGGATATGTHGSGIALGSLSSAVAELEIMDSTGALRRVGRGDPDFLGAVIHLGALGIVTRVTVDVQPAFRMRQDGFHDLPWAHVLEHLEAIFSAAESVSLFTEFDGRARGVLLKTRVPAGAEDVPVPDEFFGAPRSAPQPATERSTPVDGVVGPWYDRLPHFRVTGTPSAGSEIQSEHFVPFARGAEALDAVAALGDDIRPHLHTAELRAVAGDDLWLSPTQGERSLCIAFTWQKHPDEVASLIPRVEQVLEPFGQRPHWGKMSSLDGAAIADRYPRLPDFRDLVARADPDGVFRGPFLSRVIGV